MPFLRKPNTHIALDRIEVAAPCSADWEQMKGDERVRFCGECSKSVYDLSDMTGAEAGALILERGENLCVQFYRRQDGKVIVDNCPVGLRAVRNRCRRVVAAAVAVLGWLAPQLVQAQSTNSQGQFELGRTRGKVSVSPINGQGHEPPGLNSETKPASATDQNEGSKPGYLRTRVHVEDIAATDSGIFVDVDRAVRGLLVARHFKVSYSGAVTGNRSEVYSDTVAQDGWRGWYGKTSTNLFEAWKAAPQVTGQMTVVLSVARSGQLSVEDYGVFFPATADHAVGYTAGEEQFRTAIMSAVAHTNDTQTLQLPSSSRAEKITFSATFGFDDDQFPRHDAQGFGVFAKVDEKGNVNITPGDKPSHELSLGNVNSHGHGLIITNGGSISVGKVKAGGD